MLAERKRKTKWILNPGRQPLWNEGSTGTKFGKEIMEKMGWRVGQGLGVNEQGIKEPLNIVFKSDNKGVGFKDNENEWIQQQHDFNQLLCELSSCSTIKERTVSEDASSKVSKSLEERSRRSKARVHYRKFTRGKDLTRYSEKDLESILGNSKIKSSDCFEKGNEEQSVNSNGEEMGLTTISAGSMVDYFAEKMRTKLEAKKNGSFLKIENNTSEYSVKHERDYEIEKCSVYVESKTSKKKKNKPKRRKDETAIQEITVGEGSVEENSTEFKTDNSANVFTGLTPKSKEKANLNVELRSIEEDGSLAVNESDELLGNIYCGKISKKSLYDNEINIDESHVEDGTLKKKKERKRKQREYQEHDSVREDSEEFAQDFQKKKKKMTIDGVDGIEELECVIPDNVFTSQENVEIENSVEAVFDAKLRAKQIEKKKKSSKKCHAEEKGKRNAEIKEGLCVNKEYSINTCGDDGVRNVEHEDRASNNHQLEPGIYKAELLKRANKLESRAGNKLLNLIYCANVEKFSGSNLGLVKGYGIVRYTNQSVTHTPILSEC